MSPTAAMADGTSHLGRWRCTVGTGAYGGGGSSTTAGASGGASCGTSSRGSRVMTPSYWGFADIWAISLNIVAGTPPTISQNRSQSQSQEGVEIGLINQVVSGLWFAGQRS